LCPAEAGTGLPFTMDLKDLFRPIRTPEWAV
jgi:hypothetical protein